MCAYKKGGTVDIQEWVCPKRSTPTDVTVAKPEESAVSPSLLLALFQTNKLRARSCQGN